MTLTDDIRRIVREEVNTQLSIHDLQTMLTDALGRYELENRITRGVSDRLDRTAPTFMTNWLGTHLPSMMDIQIKNAFPLYMNTHPVMISYMDSVRAAMNEASTAVIDSVISDPKSQAFMNGFKRDFSAHAQREMDSMRAEMRNTSHTVDSLNERMNGISTIVGFIGAAFGVKCAYELFLGPNRYT
jgi:hypothetical protein